MGAFIDIGIRSLNNNYGDRGLTIGLNRIASNALEMLLDETLQKVYPKIHEKIMEQLVLDQISFFELSTSDFNIVIKAINDYISGWKKPSELQLYQKTVWEEAILPLVQQDERYQQD